MTRQVYIQRKILSDKSHVFYVVLTGEYVTRIGSTRLRLICASQLDAETIEAFLLERIAKHEIISIE